MAESGGDQGSARPSEGTANVGAGTGVRLVAWFDTDGRRLPGHGSGAGPNGAPGILEAVARLVARRGREVVSSGIPAVDALAPAAGLEPTCECLLVPAPGGGEAAGRLLAVVRDLAGPGRHAGPRGESEQRFRLLAENSSDMLTRHDPSGLYLYVSPASLAITGYTPEELIGRSPYEFIHPDDLASVRQNHVEMLAGVGLATVVFRGLRRDGSVAWLETTVRAVRNEATGQVEELHCVTRDVTRRKRADEEARASRELLESVLDNSPAVVYIKDIEGHYLLINRRYETLFDVDRRTFLGRTDHDVFVRDRADALRANDRSVVEGGSAQEFEELVPHADGLRTYLSVKFPLNDRHGRPYAVCGISTDITRRINAEAALRETSALLRSILDNMTDAVIVIDDQDRLLVFNPAARRMFGGKPGDATRSGLVRNYGLFRPDTVTPIPLDQFPLTLALRGESVNDVEIYVRHQQEPQGTWVLVNARPLLDAEGAPRRGMAVCRDTTERKRAMERLRLQNEQLQESARLERQAHEALKQAEVQLVQAEKLASLGQMVAGVAHEVNNPLAFVSNNMAVLQRDVDALRRVVRLYQEADGLLEAHAPELAARVHALAEEADLAYGLENLERLIARSREGLRRIQQIVKDLKDFARPDQGDLQAADLNAGVTSTVNIIHGLARSRGVEVLTVLEPLPQVVCYPGKINQVVMNLVSNAVDACAAGGHVVVHTQPAPDGGGVVVSVKDDGHGIRPEDRDRIFDPFFTTKPVGQGIGLGLSISYGIVKAHGGQIEVDSAPGRGATFTVRLPLAPPAAPPAP